MKFMKGEKLRMGIIRNQDFGILALKISALQRTWDLEWEDGGKQDREKISEICAAVMIGFCRGLRGDFFS